MHEARNVAAIHAVGKWQQFAFRLQLEIGVLGEKFLHDAGIFLRLKAAGAVNQNAAGFQFRRGELEQFQLRLLQPRNFLRRKSASANPRGAA